MELFRACFAIPQISYNDSVVANMTAGKCQKWSQFLEACRRLEPYIKTFVVPLAFDQKYRVYWMDYPRAYVRQMQLNPLNTPSLIVVMKITKRLKYDTKYPVLRIEYDNRINQRVLRDRVIQELEHVPGFRWDRREEEMSIDLS